MTISKMDKNKIDNNKIDIKVATITLSVTIDNCILNLLNIGRYLDIDEDIIGIKYNHANLNVLKGKYSTTIYKKAKNKDEKKINKELFYNQITLVVNNNGNHVNVKIFANGSLHMTGCKTTDEGKEVTTILFNKLDKLRERIDNICIVKDMNGLYLDKDNIIYSYEKYRAIGYKKDKDTYVINNKEYEIDYKTQMLATKKMEIQRKKRLINFNGEEIGYYKLELLKNKNKFYKRNMNIYYDWENNLIYHNNDLIIGKIQYEVNDSKITNIEEYEDVMEIEYKCDPFIEDQNNIKEKNIEVNVNCINVYFNINYKINRQRLYEKLLDMNYICKYKPESYSGIKFIYKIPIEYDKEFKLNNGYCKCTYKCTCKDVTFLIFQSGNIIVSGFKNINIVKPVINNFMNICDDIEEYIKTKEQKNIKMV
jgi:TATA-box binding protein (TBP) (component of TFIID and TFIIIB)